MQAMAGNAGSYTSNPNAGAMQAHLQSYQQTFAPKAPAASRVQSTPSYGSPSYYTVQSGDTLSGIASRYGLNWNNIADWNNISNPKLIQPGQRLVLHGASHPYVPTNSGSAIQQPVRPTQSVAKAAVPTTTSASNPPVNNDPTLADIAKKYGIDISQGYANNQANAQFQGKQDALNNSLANDKNAYNTQLQALLDAYNKQQDTINQQKQQNTDLNKQNLQAIQDNLNQGLSNADQSYFLKGLDQAQAQENHGLNAGIAADQNLRLAMNKQNAIGALDNTATQQKGTEANRYAQRVAALADALQQAQSGYATQRSKAYDSYTGQTGNLQSQLADLAQQRAATAQQIHNQQLAQALAEYNTTLARNDRNNQFNQSQAWQQYTYNHMSAQQQQQFKQNAQQYGQTMAWNIEQLKQQIAAANSAYTGFNQGSGGGGASYQSDLAKAAHLVSMDPSQLGAFNWIIQHESSFNPNAQNHSSTAHGYAQFLNSTQQEYDRKMGLNYNSSGANQLAEAYQYMVDRYGSPTNAMKFWQEHSWY